MLTLTQAVLALVTPADLTDRQVRDAEARWPDVVSKELADAALASLLGLHEDAGIRQRYYARQRICDIINARTEAKQS